MNDLFDRLEEFKNDYNKVPKKMIVHISWHEDEKGKALDEKKAKKTRFEERKFYSAQKSNTLDFIYNYDMMVQRCAKHILSFNKESVHIRVSIYHCITVTITDLDQPGPLWCSINCKLESSECPFSWPCQNKSAA